jgi:hypothetical protein
MCGGLDEIAMLNSLSHLLSGMRIILVLSDMNPTILVEAHRLHPRYVEHEIGDFENVRVVIGNIVGSINVTHDEYESAKSRI